MNDAVAPAAGAPQARPVPSGARFEADPWADEAIATIMGGWALPQALPPTAENGLPLAVRVAAQWKDHWDRLDEVTSDFSRWDSNRAVQTWKPPQTGMIAPVQSALTRYLKASQPLPDWACTKKLARAEEIFMDNGVLSVTLLFCSSLPECYVLPDLSAVLQATGQLTDHTDYRIRQTGAMIFPVMNTGGMTQPDELGVAQILKVRLIHATIRNLILRGSPETTLQAMASAPENAHAGLILPIVGLESTQNMHHRLFGMGWNVAERGLPCNQEELAYTLLTFGYVYLRSLRVLGIGYGRDDEEAFLHAWNVAGHFLGIQKDYLPETMDAACEMFDRLQREGRARIAARKTANPAEVDPRPALGRALMGAMETVIPKEFALLKPFPTLLTRHLCGKPMAQDLGIDGGVPAASVFLFAGVMGVVRVIDTLVGLVAPGFAISRWISRKLGAPLTYQLMMDQTRALKLPTHLRNHIQSVLARWSKP